MSILAACSGTPPDDLGNAAAGLARCPDSPNCVSSLERRTSHRVEPLAYTVSREQAADALLRVLAQRSRVEVTLTVPDYVRAEFTSLVLRFVDDVEFWMREPGMIHVRSASRLGYKDFGVNRARVESLREELAPYLQP